MKIVINRCYGGFGLSVEARKRLIASGSSLIKKMAIAEYCGDSTLVRTMSDAGDGFTTDALSLALYKDGFAFVDDVRREDRNAPDLVSLVEELGSLANGRYAELGVVEIPDGVEWEISEYDGVETVEEKHRSWS